MKIIFAGGGTGGHLFSGIALAEAACKREGQDILFVGTAYGLEKEIVPQNAYRLEFIPVKQIKGKGIFHRLKAFLQIPYAFWKSFLLLRKENPDLVFGIGGYASGPVTLMARLMGIKTAIIEQNAYPGFTNRVLGKFVHVVFIAFENARKFFDPKKTFLTGNPVRQGFFEIKSPLTPLYKGGEDKITPLYQRGAGGDFTLLILGGSQGAHSLNQAMIEAARFLVGSGISFRIIHQTGKPDFPIVKEAYAALKIETEVKDFISDIQNYYAQADLVISRSGAGTVTELENMGKPAILVPYPHAADDHQRLNALELVKAGAALMILHSDLNGALLAREIQILLSNPDRLKSMSEKAKKLAKPQAAAEILRICKGIINKQTKVP